MRLFAMGTIGNRQRSAGHRSIGRWVTRRPGARASDGQHQNFCDEIALNRKATATSRHPAVVVMHVMKRSRIRGQVKEGQTQNKRQR